MKIRFIYWALMAGMPFVVEGRSYRQCQAIAQEILGAEVQSPLKAKTKTAETPSEPYLVFGAAEQPGFAIISTDDARPAVIGYALDAAFDCENMPPQLSAFLEAYGASAQAAPSTAVYADDEFLLQTAKFNQRAPYNDLCPAGTATGCVATAMAIKMAYHKWPDRGRGSHEYVSYQNGQTMNMDFDFPIDWDNILDDYSGGFTEAQGRAVAQLMLACGVATEMDYGTDGSGASCDFATNAMSKNFAYSPDAYIMTKANFDDQQWDEMVRKSLKECGPIIYNGIGPYGGHAFIVDGYKNEYYHVNWGWGGYCDGYFLLSALTPEPYSDYSYHQGALLNSKPDYQKSAYCPFRLTKSDKDDLAPGLVTDAEWVTDGDFIVAARYLANCDLVDHRGTIAVLLVDGSGTVKAVMGSNNVDCPAHGCYIYFTMGCHSDMVADPGDKLVLGYREGDSEDWITVPGDGCATTWIDAFANEPLMCPLTWRVDDSLGVYTSQSDEEALYDSRYSFTIIKQPSDDAITVTVNGVPVQPLGSYADYLFYDFVVDRLQEYVIEAYPGVPVIRGDANGDGCVSVTDIVNLVSVILGQEIEYLDRDAADINGDGIITVTDIVGIVDIILTNQ